MATLRGVPTDPSPDALKSHIARYLPGFRVAVEKIEECASPLGWVVTQLDFDSHDDDAFDALCDEIGWSDVARLVERLDVAEERVQGVGLDAAEGIEARLDALEGDFVRLSDLVDSVIAGASKGREVPRVAGGRGNLVGRIRQARALAQVLRTDAAELDELAETWESLIPAEETR
ncbi:MAG: hypothetical protein JWM85_436 [Acidimicrobiaceae bacterium]|nr:hypothetical protein [Acidimicrobiaceae bacterium]